MANVTLKDSTGVARSFKASGSGTDLDPFVIEHAITGTLSADGPIPVAGGGTIISVTLSVSTTPYTIGDVFGGEFVIPNAMRDNGTSGWLTGVSFRCPESGVTPAGRVFIFGDNPAGNEADNAAVSYQATDAAKHQTYVDIAAGDYTAAGSAYAYGEKRGMAKGVKAGLGPDLYGKWVLTNAPDLATATAFYIDFEFVWN